MSKQTKIFFTVIIFLAFILRFFKLGSIPPSLYWDEASLGYNGYSILTTGEDEFGNLLPLDKFIAFGDFKPVGYIYATVPAIFIFGLNEFAVRFPSALAGLLMVVFTFYLVKKLFEDEKLALLTSFLLAVSPWSLHLSRVAFEANLAALFNLLAIYFFVKGIKSKGWWLILGMVSFAAAFYTFNSNRVLLPIMMAMLVLVYFRNLWAKKEWFAAGLITVLILLIPLFPFLRTRESKLRFQEVNIFSNLDVVLEANQRISDDGGSRLAKLIHHRDFGHLSNFLKHYFDHFSGEFLFISGDGNPRLSVRSVGELYFAELPFFLVGLFLILKNMNKKPYLLVLLWFLLAPIPAATARETPHALRIVSILPTPQIITSLGLYRTIVILKDSKYKLLFHCFIVSLFLLCFGYYLYSYYFVFPQKYAGEWLDGYKQAVEYIKTNQEKYDKIYITNYYNRPYIYFLLYLGYPSDKYNMIVDRERDWFGNWTVKSFDKFIFSDNPANNNKVLYLAQPGTVINGFYKTEAINNNFGQPAFWVLEKL